MDLQRFIEAQAEMYVTALAEIRRGRKRSHWMWFIFPQILGLGSSPISRHYAIRDCAEAIAYLDHPILGSRLVECTEAALLVDIPAVEIFGPLDALKLCSCMTLFEHAAEPQGIFTRAIENFFQGRRDLKTLEILDIQQP
jgi:uncharacterized protein (DUF1810 family)